MNEKRCVQCAFWNCGFDNACLNPCSPYFEQDRDGDAEICECFEPEVVNSK